MVWQEIVSSVFKYWRMDMTAHVQTLTNYYLPDKGAKNNE
jgi:hypothetical protein